MNRRVRIFCFIFLCSFIELQASIIWSDPVTISSANINASDPQIVIDSQGNATAAWVENSVVMASSLPTSGSWGASVALSNPFNSAISPKLGVDTSGNVTALWLENGQIESATLPFSGSWSAETSPISSSGASSPALTIDASGNAVAVWARGGVIESSTRISGVWNTVSTLSGSNSDNPQVAISSNGTVIAVWHRIVSGADVIMSATMALGSNWNSAHNVFNGTAAMHHNYPQVAIDSIGNAIVVWFRYNYVGQTYTNVSLLTSSLNFNASSWIFPPTFISNPGLVNPAKLVLKVAFDPYGNAIALWTNSYDGQTFCVESAVLPFGKTWSGSAMIYSPSLYSFAADIAVNSLGDIIATYMIWDGSLLKIQSEESDIASPVLNSWTIAKEVSQGSDNGYPRCAVTLIGNISIAVVVWINFNGTNSVIQASVGTNNELMPPINLNIVQNMTNHGAYIDFFNTITWESSPSLNISQYNIYRNGVFFTATDSNTFQISDHNAVQNGSVTYGVAAMDLSYSQSSIATVSFP